MLHTARWGLGLVGVLLVSAPAALGQIGAEAGIKPAESSPSEKRAAAWLERHRGLPTAVRIFVQRLPKGGDIHTHLSGAVYAESYLKWAMEDGHCVEPTSLKLFAKKDCAKSPTSIPASQLIKKSKIYNDMVDRWSTRNKSFAGQSGHDQFFEAFEGFDLIANTPNRKGDMVAEVANRAASQHIGYLEILITLQSSAVRQLAQSLQGQGDWAQMHRQLLGRGLLAIVTQGQRELDQMEAQSLRSMRCLGLNPEPGCRVAIRFQQQTNRTRSPAEVFAQLAFAFAMASTDPRVVGINLVAPEDHPVALRDYTLQMAMLRFLRSQYPTVKVSLHAGELTLALVPPEHLRTHLWQAVTTAKADRIGHGVDVSYENNSLGLIKLMRERGVLVEICLTSNETILNVQGPSSPFTLYWPQGVPVTLASDDEGISRIDLSHEYQLAVQRYGLTYGDLKRLARNSLEYSFLHGPSLWTTPTYGALVASCRSSRPGQGPPSAPCAAFLHSSERARAQWRLEEDFSDFESLPWLQ